MAGCNAFAIVRDTAGVKGVKTAIARLEAGNILLVDPEGTRTVNGSIGPVRPVGVFAECAAVPIVPVLIEGAHEVWPEERLFSHFGRIGMIFGQPLKSETVAGDGIRYAILGLKGE